MFSKIDKKVLIVSIIALAVVLLAGFFVYKYLNLVNTKVENSAGGVQTESPESPI